MDALLRFARIDLAPPHRTPAPARFVLACIVAIGGSIAVDVVLVAIGTALFPHLRHYAHFQFGDYGKLTIIGVVIACLAWPLVVRVSNAPRWLFVRLAVIVTLVLWLPDVYIWHQGQPVRAVGVLMVMHLAIAVVTYEALVRIAPPRAAANRGAASSLVPAARESDRADPAEVATMSQRGDAGRRDG